VNLGPHGMHPVGQTWVSQHPDVAERNGASACRDCHGMDYHGTVLSRSLADRTLSTEFGTKNFWQGFQIGCYTCHKGPDSEKSNPNRAPKATSASAASTGAPVQIALKATDADGDPLTLRIVSQPAHGNAGLSGTTATYYPDSGSVGTDSFTFAAWDGQTDSNLGTVTIGTSPQGNHPLVTTVKATTGPFKITITGQNFEAALQVFINGTPWTGVNVKSPTKLVIKKGSALQALFPPDTFVPILLLNPGSGLDTEIEFNVTTNQWRLIH